jgi:DNA-binding CsgD family transcriptional regulator
VPALGVARKTEPEAIDGLIRQLVHYLGGANETTGNGSTDEAQEIILDTELDGARYLLVRLPRPSRSSPSLSPREHEIVRMIADGHPNKVIAGVLNIRPWTVGTHLRRIFAKLGVSSRAALVSHFLEIRGFRQSPEPRTK